MWLALGKPAIMHKGKYWEIHNSIIRSILSREDLKLQACSLIQIYNYLLAIRLPTPQCTASWISHYFRLFFIYTKGTYIGVVGTIHCVFECMHTFLACTTYYFDYCWSCIQHSWKILNSFVNNINNVFLFIIAKDF